MVFGFQIMLFWRVFDYDLIQGATKIPSFHIRLQGLHRYNGKVNLIMQCNIPCSPTSHGQILAIVRLMYHLVELLKVRFLET